MGEKKIKENKKDLKLINYFLYYFKFISFILIF